jgi:DNA repair exonuclease SbcCD ATPase subunit
MYKEFLHTDRLSQVEKIIHIADVHVRNFKRHDEYKKVFDKVYDYCRTNVLLNPNTIIYLAGDIVHAKTDMSPELISIVTDFLNTLSKIAPTVLIAGNHDCNLNNFSRMDALTPIVDFIDSDSNDLFYLKETGVYTLQNVDFVLNSVYEDPENFILAKDVVSDNIKIVLFHGAVDMASTDMGMTMKNKHITIEKFDGFDYGLFGDIHKFQYLDSKCKFAYAGSLIQQNFGEGLIHGIIEWDLVNKKSKFVRIENEWTYHTVEVDNGVVKKYPTEFSKINSIRLKTNNTSNADIFNIVTELKSKANVVDIRVQRVSNKLTNQQQTTTKLLGDIRDVEQQNDLIVDFIKTRYNVKDETLEDIKNINRKINTMLSESDIVRNLIWQPIEFEFDNMFSYGEGNSINFDDMNGVYGLFAPNATGKSSILDAFMFCIFDKCSRTYKASQIMNNQKETFKCKLTFRLAGNTYVIERTGVKDKKGAVKVNVDFWREDDGGRVVLNGQDRDSTNFIIRKYLGTYDDFIITAMSLQGNNTNFVDKAQRERKDLLAQFLDLDLFEELNGIASDEVKGVQTLIKEFSKQDYSTKIADSKNKYKNFSSKLDEIIDEKNSIHKTLEKLSDEIIDLNKSIVDIDSNFKNLSLEDLDSKLEIASNKLVTTNKQIKDFELESKSLNERYSKTQDRLSTIDKETITKKRDEMDKLKIILSDYESDLRSIRLKINHCESKIDNLKTHEYDPNCKYCTNNVFVQDAMKAENSLVDLVNDEKELIGKIDELESTLSKNSEVYTELNRLHHFENELFGIQKEIYKIEKELYAKKETAVESKNIIDKTNEMIKRYKDNKDAIVNNEKVRSKIKEIEAKKYQLSNYRLKELEDEIIECSGRVKVHEKIINECAESIDKLKELEKEFYAYDYYLKAVNRNGVPYQLISDALPKIQAETNNILSQIVDFQVLFDTDGKSINTYIVYDDENFWALELSSGMEKFISSLAIRTALISISSLPRPNFIVIDEGLGALDPTVLNNFALFLDYLKTQFDFAILISHIDIVRDIVDSQIDIKKENGYSAINF